MIFSRFRLLSGLLGCFLVANFVQADSVEIVTPEASTDSRTTTVVSAKTTTPAHTAAQKDPPKRPPSTDKAFEWPSNDTYVQAYVQLHRRSPSKRNDNYAVPHETSYNTVIRSSIIPEHKYPSLTQDWTSSRPIAIAPPPAVPPYPSYGPPHSHQHHYEGAHAPTSHWSNKPYSSPSSFSFFGLLPKKLSVKLIFKIILKLILFKMIVKFIAVICLLLFFPALKSKDSHGGINDGDDDDDDDARKLKQLHHMSDIILNSIANNQSLYGNGLAENDDDVDDDDAAEEEELKYIKKIADLADRDPPTSGAYRAVVFLRYCVQAVERITGFMIRRLRSESHENHSWSSNVIKNMMGLLCLCLKLLDVQVPPIIDVREEAVLKCKFDLEGDELYSVKWYKEELEFFRYMPDNTPTIQTFPVEGVHIVESKCNVTVITLAPLEYGSTGVYRCEVSSERPHFKTVYKSENMTVLGLPKGGPVIEGIKQTYFLGDYITGNCTSSPSNPAAQIHWFINDKKAEDWFLEYYNPPKKKETLNLESRVLGLRFQVDMSHYQGRNQNLSLTCQSSVAGKTKTQRINVYLSRMMTNQKFAQEQINSKGSSEPVAGKLEFHLVILTGLIVSRL